MFIQLCAEAFLSASLGTAPFNADFLLGDFKEQILLILINSLIALSVV